MRELFDITKIIFEQPGEWQNVTSGEKRKYYFAIQRRFSIQFPMQANALQHLKINQSGVVDFWQRFMRKTYNRTPGWMYTKGVKKAKETKEKKVQVSGKLIDEYAKRMKIDKKSIMDSLEYWPDLMLAELKQYEKMINQK
jgi:hypothetical protein